jgi:hypothetical protein
VEKGFCPECYLKIEEYVEKNFSNHSQTIDADNSNSNINN